MKSDNQLWEICMDIYKEAFAKAIPKADFDKLIETGEAKEKDFFMKYYLSNEEVDKIVEQYIKQNKLSHFDAEKIRMEVFLGCLPNSCKETWEKAR